MKIAGIKYSCPFKGAMININAFSDIHGHIERADSGYQTMLKNKTFEENKTGKINFLIDGGDWFVACDKKGFKSSPNRTLGDFLIQMQNVFVNTIKAEYPNTKSIFIPGNHEFDGGEESFNKIASGINSKIISSNMDLRNSPTVNKLISEGKIVNYTVDFVQDDKNPKTYYPVLNIGVSPFNMKHYNEEVKGVNFINNIPAPIKAISKNRYAVTTMAIKSIIDGFKSEYPQGIVIATCHTGAGFAENLAEVSKPDIIFNAHEHKTATKFVNNTPIINLSQDFDKIVNAKIRINNKGKKSGIEIKEYFPLKEKFKQTSPIGEYFKELFGKEAKKTHTIKSIGDDIQELSTEGIRKGNNHLANFVADILLKETQKEDPRVDIFALNSSSIRSGFELSEGKNASRIEILNCLTGITPKQAKIFTTDISGEELAEFIVANFIYNAVNKEENPIMQYAGIKIDKTNLMKDYHSGKSFGELCRNITLKRTNNKIIPSSTYRIANTLKYFQKSQLESDKNIYGRSHSLDCNAVDMFQSYFEENEPVIFETENRIY